MFNHAVYAERESRANASDAAPIQLDAFGNAINTRSDGSAFPNDVVYAACDTQGYQAYNAAMTFLDTIFGLENCTQTVNRFNLATGKIEDRAHAERLQEKLVLAALNGSQAALIAYASVSLYLNPYQAVDFGWFTNGSDELTTPITQEDGYPVQTGPATITVNVTLPSLADEADFEGFATTYHAYAPIPVTDAPTIRHAKGDLTRYRSGWVVRSNSNPDDSYTTAHDGSTCTCPGFNGRYRKCWHTATVRAHVADQQSQERANALPVMPRRRRGLSKMWK